MSDEPSEVRSLKRQLSTLEISPLITNIAHWLVTALYGNLQSASSLVGCESCVNCCVGMVFSESRNYVISQVAGLKPLKTNRHDCSAFRVYVYVYE
jgi:hypothetical protein